MITDEEFIMKAVEILKQRGCPAAKVTNSPDFLFLGNYSYMRRFELVGAAEELLKLEGYKIVKEVKQ